MYLTLIFYKRFSFIEYFVYCKLLKNIFNLFLKFLIVFFYFFLQIVHIPF